MAKSTEYNRDGEASVEKVVTKTGPLGILPILYIAMSLLIMIAGLIWWMSK